MFGWDEAEQVHSQVNSGQHDGSFTHELIAGAAGFEALRAFEQHKAANGQPQNYALAKEILAGFAAGEADKLVETKGLNYLDREKAKSQAVEQANTLFDQKYAGDYQN